MKIRKNMSFILSFLLVFNLFFNNCGMIVNAEEPASTLIINSILVNKQTALAGDKVNVTLDAADDVNGISKVRILYELPSGSIAETQLALTDGKYTGTVDVGSSDNIIGGWKVNEIKVTDNNGTEKEVFNNEIYNNDLSGFTSADLSSGDFEVTGTAADTEAPTLIGIKVDKQTAIPGDTVTITADITDNFSGISYAWVNYQLPSGKHKDIELTQQYGEYVGTINISQYSESGSWKFNNIDIADYAENHTTIYNDEINSENGLPLKDYRNLDFKVTGTTPDAVAPVLNNISIDKTSYTAGDKINLVIDAADNLSGVNSVEASYTNNNVDYKKFTFNLIDGVYKCQDIIDVFDAPGTWKLDSVSLTDGADNTAIYYNKNVYTDGAEGILEDFSTYDFTIFGTLADNNAPVLNSISVDKKDAAEGDFVKVTVDAKDNESGISFIYAMYKFENGEESDITFSYSNGSFIGYLNLNNCSGTAKVEFVEIEDNAGNNSYYVDQNANSDEYQYYENIKKADLSAGNINVTSAADKDNPVFNSVTLDKSQAVLGDKVKITISASDLGSGIQKAVIKYVSDNFQYKEIVANKVGDLLVGYFYVNKYDDTLWNISCIDIYDNAMNKSEVGYGTAGLENGNISISSTIPDDTFPNLNSVSVENKELEKGQIQKIYVDASDDVSGIKSIKARYSNENEGFEITDFTFDSETNKYVASFNPADYTSGTDFTLGSVEVIDNRANVTVAGYFGPFNTVNIDLTNGNFKYNTSTFPETPIFKSVSIDNKSLITGQEVTFTVEAAQTTNPITYSYIEIVSPAGKTESVPLELVNGKYIGKLKIMDYFDKGVWEINAIALADEFGDMVVVKNGLVYYTNESIWDYVNIDNYQSYSLDLSSCDFTVDETNTDNNTPIFNKILVSKNKAAFGDKVKITVYASDDLSGIKSVGAEFQSDFYNDYDSFGYYVTLNQVSNGQYEGYLDLSSVYDDTIVMLGDICIEDNNGNINCIFNNKHLNFGLYILSNPKAVYKMQDLSCCDIPVYYQNELYDLNKDGDLSIADLAKAAQSYNVRSSDISWDNVKFNDVNGDNTINVNDLIMLSKVIR